MLRSKYTMIRDTPSTYQPEISGAVTRAVIVLATQQQKKAQQKKGISLKVPAIIAKKLFR